MSDKYQDLLSGSITLAHESNEGEPRTENDEWLIFPWRALSAGMLHDRPIDFPEKVLKAAAPRFNLATIFPDHRDAVSCWLGKTDNARFSNAKNGRPAGVDFDCWFDLTIDPNNHPDSYRVVDGVKKGVLRSGSVDVRYSYEPSHPNLENWRYRLGEIVDGEMVRLVVTEIHRIGEFSIVYAGADEHATRLAKKRKKTAEFNKLSEEPMDQIKKFLKLSSDATETEVLAAIKQHGSIKLEIDCDDNTKAITDKSRIIELAKTGISHLTGMRERAKAAYQTVRGDNAKQDYLKSIDQMDLSMVASLVDEYEAQAEEKVPLKCECGKLFSRKSSQPGENESGSDGRFDFDIL